MQNVYFERERITVDDADFPEFCSHFHEIPAGGGLVRNKEGKYLLIYRHRLWDLPKGKQEPDEKIEDCALREVEEETGLHNLRLGERICITHHTYQVFGEKILKHTYWYRMFDDAEENLLPQEEEDITKVMDGFRVGITPYYASLMDPDDPNCPVRMQAEEDITGAKWVEKECLPDYLEGTYPSIVEVFVSAGLL